MIIAKKSLSRNGEVSGGKWKRLVCAGEDRVFGIDDKPSDDLALGTYYEDGKQHAFVTVDTIEGAGQRMRLDILFTRGELAAMIAALNAV